MKFLVFLFLFFFLPSILSASEICEKVQSDILKAMSDRENFFKQVQSDILKAISNRENSFKPPDILPKIYRDLSKAWGDGLKYKCFKQTPVCVEAIKDISKAWANQSIVSTNKNLSRKSKSYYMESYFTDYEKARSDSLKYKCFKQTPTCNKISKDYFKAITDESKAHVELSRTKKYISRTYKAGTDILKYWEAGNTLGQARTELSDVYYDDKSIWKDTTKVYMQLGNITSDVNSASNRKSKAWKDIKRYCFSYSSNSIKQEKRKPTSVVINKKKKEHSGSELLSGKYQTLVESEILYQKILTLYEMKFTVYAKKNAVLKRTGLPGTKREIALWEKAETKFKRVLKKYETVINRIQSQKNWTPKQKELAATDFENAYKEVKKGFRYISQFQRRLELAYAKEERAAAERERANVDRGVSNINESIEL